jgi:hypothetical protein
MREITGLEALSSFSEWSLELVVGASLSLHREGRQDLLNLSRGGATQHREKCIFGAS